MRKLLSWERRWGLEDRSPANGVTDKDGENEEEPQLLSRPQAQTPAHWGNLSAARRPQAQGRSTSEPFAKRRD